jgi:hypothetical protein
LGRCTRDDFSEYFVYALAEEEVEEGEVGEDFLQEFEGEVGEICSLTRVEE